MKTYSFNNGWRYAHLDQGDWKDVTLPHDAMIDEERSDDAACGVNGCWIEGKDYEYEKTFTLPEELKGKVLNLEFEAVYMEPEVYLNGEKIAFRPYGYTNFYVDISEAVKWDGENTLRVIARNAAQPNSRWYSGAGIYRPVWLHVQEQAHINMNGIKIRTAQINPAVVEVKVAVNQPGTVKVQISKDGATVAKAEAQAEDNTASFTFEIADAKLWTPETPELYECTAEFGDDAVTEKFGIRTATVTAKEGFCLNGERVIIRGGCIHHDNGILGARCYDDAEYRKIAILKKAGYNAVRSAHNPCSKAMLRACDELGMLMMDEYVDMWYIHKCKFDYGRYVMDWYRQDIADMIDKDYNHPCVILYSLGNEVAETAQKKGIEFFKQMKAVCKELDPDRPVTVGVNIFFNFLSSIGMGQYSDKKSEKEAQKAEKKAAKAAAKAEKEAAKKGADADAETEKKPAKAKKKKAVGSEFFNNLAGMLGSGFMTTMATMYFCDVTTRGCYAEMDAAGYNYGIKRYKHDVKKYPDRVILGSETFCSDAYKFWELAKDRPALIGDFVWSGIDYLGENGIGAWEYRDYAEDFTHGNGWMTAGAGRVDLIGNELGEALYTKVAFELEEGPYISVVPVNHTNDKHSPSAWKFSNAIPSWSWNGLNGNDAQVEVYSRAPRVALYINGTKVGEKKFKKNCRYVFKTKYADGEVKAVALDNDGKELASSVLTTAGNDTQLTVAPEKASVKPGELCFIRLKFTDANGTVKPLERANITVSVAGGELLAVGSAAPVYTGSYLSDTTDTYYGEAMCVVKAGESGQVSVSAVSGDMTGSAVVAVE
ncbi:MAG: glycoside hydrolase family 2 protein [Clostridia bacterium]|nr:glycoside hydrolase family 2 protein [Clostridia bacterium]